MASCSKEVLTTKDGRRYWKISVSRGYGKSPYTTRFYWPTKKDGSPVAKSSAESARDKFMVEFESQCKDGAILNREERKAKEAAERAEAAKIKTFKQYGEQVFMPAKKEECAEKTRKYYQNALDNHLYPVFGDTLLTEITSAQLSAFFLSKQASSLSHSSVLGIYVTANQLFEMAYAEDAIQINPLYKKVKRPRQRKDDKKQSDPPRFTQDEVKHIKECLKREPLKWQALVWILLDCGLRRGECCALTWDKVDFNGMEIKVDGSLGYTPERGIYRDSPKTEAGRRTVPMTAEVADILRRYKAEQVSSVAKRTKRLEKEHKPLDFKKIAIPQYLFTAKGESDPIFPDAVNRYFKRFEEKYGIEDFHPHKCRHTFASILVERGVSILVVAALLGHDDPHVTHRTYSHAEEKFKRDAIAILADATKIG